MNRMSIDVDSDSWAHEVSDSKTLTVIDFWHASCPWCIKLNPVFNEVAETFKGKVKSAKLNVFGSQANQEIALKHGVMSTPTLMFFCKGRSVGQVVGFKSKEQLDAIYREMLEKHVDCFRRSSKLETST